MITTMKGNLTGLDFDIIVDPNDETLTADVNSVSRKIFREAGYEMSMHCRNLDGCAVGHAKMTLGFRLPSLAVIHMAVPHYIDGEHNEDIYLEACYWNTMCMAYEFMEHNHMEKVHIAFPDLPTYPYHFPREEACRIAVDAVNRIQREYPDTQAVQVSFICDDEQSYLVYKKELRSR
ncbi:macro domain-containing protein [Catenisphaera adipataccumulans]|jgi:O-acetyl-ADP-ribose deacetylase (regulator of RNase III)|uniref:O-acetyl-ADP-ribose deacetylase (Regulator of RNase III) n=1 Tax=Catenisphaera adipataccumulans TaxID=700500 RepID=A0A7W8CVW3_9FIRM|nr:macro domain-containing protein [Catenisphaera adipataccumulans]MBB5182577.1 O-acetyl-ADP-ribose deacetylase (regulator of RNase III) [Catenisphaera adipataccumulans]